MRKTRSGFTLVEVAVALAIFVIGAIAIIRIFPPALGAISGSGDRSVAVRINRDTEQRGTSEPKTIPSAIYDVDANYNPSFAFAGAIIGTRNRNNALPQGTESTSNDALSHFRYIVGEQCKVLKGPNNELFVLTRFPYSGSVKVYRENNIQDVQLQTNGELDFTNATVNGSPWSDTTSPAPKRPPITARAPAYTYYVSYRWIEDKYSTSNTSTAKRIQSVTDEPIEFPGTNAGYNNSPTDSAKVLQARRSYDSVANPISSVSIAKQNVAMHYRHHLDSNSVALGIQDFPANSLSVASNSACGSVALNTALPETVVAGEFVTVDYLADWSLLLEDGQPTSNNANQSVFQLPVQNLDDTLPNQAPLYSLYMAQAPDASISYITADQFDSTGTPATSPRQSPNATAPGRLVASAASAPTPVPPAQPSSLKAGRVVFNDVVGTTPRARVSYHTINHWSHQLSVAASAYAPFYQNLSTSDLSRYPSPGALQPNFSLREPWREYIWNATATDSHYLYFHPSEAGKTVLVSFEYRDASSNYHTVSGQVVTIADAIDQSGTAAPANFGGTRMIRAELRDAQGEEIIGSQRVTAIVSVQGASVQVRTAWLDGNKFTQTVLSGYRPLEGNS